MQRTVTSCKGYSSAFATEWIQFYHTKLNVFILMRHHLIQRAKEFVALQFDLWNIEYT